MSSINSISLIHLTVIELHWVWYWLQLMLKTIRKSKTVLSPKTQWIYTCSFGCVLRIRGKHVKDEGIWRKNWVEVYKSMMSQRGFEGKLIACCNAASAKELRIGRLWLKTSRIISFRFFRLLSTYSKIYDTGCQKPGSQWVNKFLMKGPLLTDLPWENTVISTPQRHMAGKHQELRLQNVLSNRMIFQLPAVS